MQLAISNIAWPAELDEDVYALMSFYGFRGLEIAPTRIFTEAPYDRLDEARRWKERLAERFGFEVPSMQSIWNGRQEKLFGTEDERESLLTVTKKAIDFAAAIGCHNLVFGCPRNRSVPEGADLQLGVRFFKQISGYAHQQNTCIGMEANPPLYHTNYINDTPSALGLISEVRSKGFRLNLDVGTMIYNQESPTLLRGRVCDINHVHISEPGLKPIERRDIHRELRDILSEEGYEGCISIEMGTVTDIKLLEEIMKYVKGIFS